MGFVCSSKTNSPSVRRALPLRKAMWPNGIWWDDLSATIRSNKDNTKHSRLSRSSRRRRTFPPQIWPSLCQPCKTNRQHPACLFLCPSNLWSCQINSNRCIFNQRQVREAQPLGWDWSCQNHQRIQRSRECVLLVIKIRSYYAGRGRPGFRMPHWRNSGFSQKRSMEKERLQGNEGLLAMLRIMLSTWRLLQRIFYSEVWSWRSAKVDIQALEKVAGGRQLRKWEWLWSWWTNFIKYESATW